MKKLMIAAVIVCAAAMVQASSFDWAIKGSSCMYAVNGEPSETYYTGDAYLFNSATVSQQAVLDAFFGGSGIDTLTSLSTATIDDGELSKVGFTWGNAGDTLNAYFAAVMSDGGQDYLFISEIATGAATAATTTSLKFDPEDASAAAPFETTTYSASGWYTQAVPEPTSGLLLLLGVAGLALRRRRA